MANSKFDKLNAQQRACVVNDDKHILVVAGAGSGKTTVLVNKILFYVQNKNIELDSIMAITFTNKAAYEIKERCNANFKELNFAKSYLGTFHSVCLRILRRYYSLLHLDPNFLVIDTQDQRSILAKFIKEAKAQDENFIYETKEASLVAEHICNLKEHKLSTSMILADYEYYSKHFSFLCEELIMLYQKYEAFKNEANVYDFTDLILKVVLLLKSNENFRRTLKNHIKAVLVDEFQDINLLQAEFINTIVDEHTYLFAVGDDDQAIYAFRGADVSYMLNLDKFYPNLVLYKLDINYRSTQDILDLANALIEHNSIRLVEKQLHTHKKSYTQKVQLVKCTNEYDECYAVCSIIKKLQDLNESLDSIAILYRNNYLSAKIEAQLRDNDIAYEIINGQNFFDREEIKTIVAYFRLAINADDNVAFERVCNIPRRSIGKSSVDFLRKQASYAQLSYYGYLQELKLKIDANEEIDKELYKLYKKFIGFLAIIESLQEAAVDCESLSSFMDLILEQTNIFAYYEQIDKKENSYNAIAKRTNNILELKRFLDNSDRTYNHFDDGQKNLEGSRLVFFLSNSALCSSSELLATQDENSTKEKVKLMTIHTSKGLEFKTVIIIDVNDDILPFIKHSIEEDESHTIDEERRLTYVAITRAGLRLYAMYVQSRKDFFGSSYRCHASDFLYEITNKFKNSKLNKDEYPYKIVQSTTLTVEPDDEL